MEETVDEYELIIGADEVLLLNEPTTDEELEDKEKPADREDD